MLILLKRKIAVIASAIFSYMTLCSVVFYCRFRAKQKSSNQNTPPVQVFKGVHSSKNEPPVDAVLKKEGTQPPVSPNVKRPEELLSPSQEVHSSKNEAPVDVKLKKERHTATFESKIGTIRTSRC